MSVSWAGNGSAEVEREMTNHQRNLVDTCFEEGQYEAGMAVLDQLRSPNFKPSRPHVRQLIYIALYPPQPEAHITYAEKFGASPASPSKSLSRHHISSLSPSSMAIEAALMLLFAFADTNTPGALLRALPSYPHPSVVGKPQATAQVADEEDQDSYIARQSIRIKNAKDCWAILKEGFVQRKADAPATPKGRRKGRRHAVDQDEVENTEMNGDSPSPVGPYAWPVLDWLLYILENDERLTQQSGQPLHSPLLLSQIPPPRAGSGAQWDVEAPLDVAFYALQQADMNHRAMGTRLLTLLINLASTTHIDLPIFINAVGSRIFALPSDGLASLLAALPPSKAVLRFKLALYKNYLTDFGSSHGSNSSRPRPQVRAQPRPIAARRRQADLSAAGSSVQTPSTPEAITETIERKYAPITPTEVLELIKNPPTADVSVSLRIKTELAISYWLLQRHAADTVDVEWQTILKDGRLKDAIEVAFPPQSVASEDDCAVRSLKQLLAIAAVH